VVKRFFLFVAGMMLAVGSGLHGQAILGTWQGTLPVTENPRIVVKIAKADGGSLRSVFYRIDENDFSTPFASVTFEAMDLSLVAKVTDVSFHGKLSANGKSIVGTWTEDKKTYPMTFALAAPDAVWKHEGVVPLAAMAENANPAFEVATIKPSQPGASPGHPSFVVRRHFAAKNATVGDLIVFAYHVQGRQIQGRPSWMAEERFDIAAEPDTEGEPSVDQNRQMLRRLLADRFRLTTRTVQKMFPVYALTVGQNAPKVTRSDPEFNNRQRIFFKPGPGGQMIEQFAYTSMADFVEILMIYIHDQQIVDETGLKGKYDFEMTMPVTDAQSQESDRVARFFSGVQSMGMKLVAKRVPIDVVVIDHVERPSAN
jgi:uncharacterized protein (TIGR03435 family)